MKEKQEMDKFLLGRKKPFTLDEVAKTYEVTTPEVKAVIDSLMSNGFRFVQEDDTWAKSKNTPPRLDFDARRMFNRGNLHFGLVSDTHLGSKHEKLDELNTMYDQFKNEGVKVVFHCGDILDGTGVYQGQEFEVNQYGQQDQIDYVIKNYPKRQGITTVFITGNHDCKQYERGGADPGQQICKARGDMKYIGQYDASVRMADKVSMEIMHPTGNQAYALSYKSQRDINNRSPEDLPNILAYGHYHTSFYMHYRGMDFVQVPCFKGSGNFEKRLGLNPTIGGWVIDGKTNGEVVYQFDPQLHSFGGGRR
jgi:predicted phosphodiesterase